jgi:hypothetical protein
MCCNPRTSHPPASYTPACCCGCGAPPGFRRRFISPEEEVEGLKAYRQELLKEAAEVEKRIAATTKS